VYDDGLPNQPSTGFPGNYFLMPALWRAFDSLWEDRAGLWRSFGQAAAHVAARFASDPMVLGYDLMNEPWPGSSWPSCAQPLGCPLFDVTLQRAEDAFALAIRAADRRHLVFLEPNFFFDAGVVSWLSTPPAAVRPVGLSFHDLCALRGALQVGQSTSLAGSGPQGDQAIDAACAPTDAQVLRNAQAAARRIGGPALLTEVTPADSGDVAGLECLLERADGMMIGWTASGISWRTGEFRELDPAKAAVLARAYPRAVAGTPLAYGFDPRTGVFVLRYRPARRIDAPTVIFLPVQIHYPLGYRVSVTGAVITSAPGATLLTLRKLPRSRIVEVRVTPHAGTVQPTAGLPTCPPDAPGVGLPAS
jgi:endoglycosylceramidase